MIIGGEFGELRAEVEQVEVTSDLPRPDPNWRFTDAQGHEHYRDTDGEYPTLRTVVDETYWCSDCNDEHTDTHLECAICGETIQTGTLPPSMFREFTPGRTEYYLNDEPISPERYRELVEQRHQEAVAAREAAQARRLTLVFNAITNAAPRESFLTLTDRDRMAQAVLAALAAEWKP